MPANTSGAFWISVTGADGRDDCAALMDQPRRAGLEIIRARYLRLDAGASCRHTLKVLGVPEASQSSALLPSTRTVFSGWVSIRVIPFNATFYPALCKSKAFSVLFVAPVETGRNVTFEVWDPPEEHLLFRGYCEDELLEGGIGSCETRTFCPTMDVLVRVVLPDQRFGSGRVSVGHERECPPTADWHVSLKLRKQYVPSFPGDELAFELQLQNLPDQLQAFRWEVHILPGFEFVSFVTGIAAVQEITEAMVLRVRADASGHVIVGGVLGVLTVRLKASRTGTVRALHLPPDSLRVLLGSGLHWLDVPHACPIRGGFVTIPVDHARCTTLIARAKRDWLVHWKGMQDTGKESFTEIEALGINNTGENPQMVGATCQSLTPKILEALSCRRIFARGAGTGSIRVAIHGLETLVSIRVMEPEDVQARVFLDGSGRPGRLQVVGRLFGRLLDITPFVLPDRPEESPVCPRGFVGNVSIGTPAMVQAVCNQQQHDPRTGLFLLPSRAWTRGCGYRVFIPELSSQRAEAWALTLASDGGLVPFFPGPLQSGDRDRLIATGANSVSLSSRGGLSPRCVTLTDGTRRWELPVMPAPPASLDVRLSTTTLVVQQDMLKLVPTQTDLLEAWLVLADGSRLDAVRQLQLRVSGNLGVRNQGSLESLFEPGVANVTFLVPGFACASTSLTITIHVSSVASSWLDCTRCPPMLATSTDPLSEAWPDQFLSAVPVDWFVVTRGLVDGGTHRQVEPVRVQGVVVDQDRQTIRPQTAGSLRVTTAFTQNELSIPVIHRWACNWTLLCNDQACDDTMLRLAPPGDGAAMAPFGYVTRLDLWVELALCNGTLLRFQSLPGVWLLVNNEATALAQIPLRPGKLALQIRFDAVWEMPRLDTELELWVHGLESLRVDVARHLQQLHCSRRWSASPVSVSGVLSDGRQEEVAGAVLTADGFNLRLDPASHVVHAMGPGVGWVMATYANHSEVALVAISMDSILFTELSLDGLPEQWSASLETRRLMHALLLPTLAVGQEEGLLDLVVRWKTDPPGIIDVASGGELVLLSDHHQPVTISGVIRSCQGAPPHVVSRPIQVNVVPDRAWQVDFGQEAGPPLPQVAIGGRLSIPIFLFCASPLLEFRAIVSIPGMGGVACTAGELPYSTCTVRDDWAVQFSGNFPASQRTGRLLVGTLEGRVLVDGLARLRVSISVPGAPTTHEFTVRLGMGPVHSMLYLPNAVVPGLVAPETSAGWSAHVVSGISACCHVQASRFKSSIAHLVSPSFRIENVTLLPMEESIRLDDPRLRVEFDRLFLSYEQGLWTLDRLAQLVGKTTEIRLRYQKPEDPAAPCLETAIAVNLVKQDSIVFEPAHALELRRLHCSVNHFEGRAIQAFLLLDNGRRIQMTGSDLFSNAVVENQTVARVERVDESTLLVQGLSTGNTSLRLKAFRLTALLPLAVLDESAVLRSIRLPDPYALEAVAGIPVPLNLSGILANGMELRDVSFLAGVVVADRAFFVDWDVAGLVARRNTHPLEASPRLTVTVPACGDAPALLVSSRLHVRLLVGLDPARPVDIAVESSPASDGFDVTLFAERVSAFLVRYTTPKDGVAMTCAPGLGMPVLADCVVESGSIILAGAFGAPRDGPIHLAFISPIPPWACGYIEYFSGETATRLPILAGCFGSWQEGADAVPSSLPVADPATLARQYAAALAHPWDRRAMQETRFTFELLVGRQRLVDVRLYSNEFELSAMFGVADRFLVPDTFQTSIDVVFHTTLLPVHPDGVEVPEGVMVPAKHVVDGWYAVQWIEAIPRLSLRVSYRVSTSTSREPWEHVVPEPLVTGRHLYECPRQAMDRASFLVVYAIPGPMPAGQNLACAAQVAPRRIVVSGPDSQGMFLVSLALESFARIHRAHVAIMDRLAPQRKRRILRPDSDLAVRLTGLVYINDTADPFAPCPQGTYYTRNGTYEKLPQHSVAGPDCHGMECVNGFVFLDAECVPATVPLNLVWVCVSAIGVLIALISCVLCALHMGRRIPQSQQDVDLISEPCTTDVSHATPDILDDDDTRDFQNIVLGSYIDDYSRTMLWDDGIDMEEQDRQRQSPR